MHLTWNPVVKTLPGTFVRLQGIADEWENDLKMVDKSETKLPELSLWKSLYIRTTEARLIYTDNDWAEGKA